MSQYDIIIVSLPGYTFSSKPPYVAGARYVARIFHRLLTERLVYSQYVVHGMYVAMKYCVNSCVQTYK